MSAKTKTVNYRRCIADAPGSSDGTQFVLYDLLKEAKGLVPRPWKRSISNDGHRAHFLAHLVEKQGCLCGTLVLWDASRMLQLVDAEPDGSTWQCEMEPLDPEGKKRKILEQSLFFAVRGNHVAVVQSRELSLKELHDFLTWFIQSTAELAPGWLFVLQNLPSLEAVAKLRDHKIKSVKIGKQAFSTVKTPIPGDGGNSKRQKYTKSISVDPLIMQLLKGLTQDDPILDDIANSTDPGSIWVDVQIRYKSRSEKDSQEIMRSLAATVGGQDDLEPEIELDGNSKIKGSELTIMDKINVQCPNGNPSEDDAMTRLAEWLNASIESGKVFS